MNFRDLQQQSEKEIRNLLLEYRNKLFNLKVDLGQGQIKNSSEIRKTRRYIARILTILNSRSQVSHVK